MSVQFILLELFELHFSISFVEAPDLWLHFFPRGYTSIFQCSYDAGAPRQSGPGAREGGVEISRAAWRISLSFTRCSRVQILWIRRPDYPITRRLINYLRLSLTL